MSIRAARSSGRTPAVSAMYSLLSSALLFGASACADVPTAPPSVADAPPALAVSVGPSGYSSPLVLDWYASEARGINKHGVIVGDARSYLSWGALLYAGGTATSIGQPSGNSWDSYSMANDINDKGQIVGVTVNYVGGVDFGQQKKAFVYDPGGGMIDIHNYADFINSEATAINSASTVAATTVVGCGIDAEWNDHAFRWTPYGGFQELVGNGGDTCAEDVNQAGTIVGWSGSDAYIWIADGSAFSLGKLGGKFAKAVAINNSGWVAGNWRTGAGHSQGFLWTWSTGMQDLGPLSPNYFVTDISDKGRIVGWDDDNWQAFTWYKGVFSYLPLTAQGKVSEAHAVNSCGTIVGTAYGYTGTEYKWVPVRWSRRTCD